MTEYMDVTLRLPKHIVEALAEDALNEKRQGNENATVSTIVADAVTDWLVL